LREQARPVRIVIWHGRPPARAEQQFNRKERKERKGETEKKQREEAMEEHRSAMNEDALSREIIGAAIEVHRHMGPGLLESAYEQCLAHELSERGIPFELQKPVPVEYKGVKLDCGFRPDFIVGGLVVAEVKAVEKLAPIHSAQVLTYLRLTGCKLGMLLNFNEWRMADGIKRVVLKL
jgi:GxxExxY protein